MMTDSTIQNPGCEVPQALLVRANRWIRAVARATELLVIPAVGEPKVLDAFEVLREATSADRVVAQVTRHTAPLGDAQPLVRAMPRGTTSGVLQLSERWHTALSAGVPVLCNAEAACPDEWSLLSVMGIQSVILIPLIVEDTFRGCIRVENCASPEPYAEQDIVALSAIGTIFSNALGYREAQGDLQESEARYKRLVDNAPDAVYRMAIPEGTYEYMSPASIEIMGYTPEQFLNTPLLIERIIHPGWRSYFVDQWARLVAGDAPREYVYAVIHGRTGDTRWLHQRNVLVRDDHGSVVAIEGIVTDVTKQQLAETRLRNREATLQSILTSAPIGIGFTSDRTLLLVNDELCRMTGYTSEELVGRTTDLLYVSYEEFQRVGLALVAQLDKGVSGSVETRWLRKDGTAFDVLLSANCLTPGDYARGVTFTALDITSVRMNS